VKVSGALDEAGVAYETEWVDALHSDRNEVSESAVSAASRS